MMYLKVELLKEDPTGSLFKFDLAQFLATGDVERFIKYFDDGRVIDNRVIMATLSNRMVMVEPCEESIASNAIAKFRMAIWECVCFLVKCSDCEDLTNPQGWRYLSVSITDDEPAAPAKFFYLDNGVSVTNEDVERFISYTKCSQHKRHISVMARLQNGMFLVESAPCLTQTPFDYERQAVRAWEKIKLKVRTYLEFVIKCASNEIS